MRTTRLLVIVSAILFCARNGFAAETVEAQLRQITQELVDAVTTGDAKVWDRYLDDKVFITNEAGEVKTKAGLVKEVVPLPDGVSGSIAIVDFHAVRHGNVAVTSYVSDEHETYHGHELHCRYRGTDTWLKTEQGWRMIASQTLAERTDPPAMVIDDQRLESYTGRYGLSDDITYEIRLTNGRLEGRRNGRAWEPLLAEAPDVLFVPGSPRYRKIFQRDAAGHITGFVERREAWDLPWRRLQ